MKLNKSLKLSLGALIAFPLSFFVGNELLANHLTEKFDNQINNDNLIACGGGGGSTPAAKAAKKAKQAKAKLSFKKRALSKAAAAGEDTSKLEAEIAELEATIAK
ncbi:hypothetical protein EU96_1449 [Prochlorococcus marinus str. MIT 9302]|uniref:Uncharacterized protein n=1 Tax=Prochlorococcus marinus str. MIT 9302 TaxID=74545 RepID=A0A0A2A4J5_PROMR|nr:hypothetical protein [Prochlorococcus marinus]KGF96812.1 hypothetical protein EU96_1449 [Prochlorococcus marinus str. MIT 9302]